MSAPAIDFDALYRDHRSRVFWAAWRKVENWADAEDATQDAFLKALEQRNDYQPRDDTPPQAWVITIAKYEAMSRANGRARALPASDWLDRVADTIPDERDAADCRCLADPDVAERVEVALAAMPPAVRTAARLYCLEGLSATEVAQRMGNTRHAVHELIYRALNHVDLSGPAWRDLNAERGVDSQEAALFRASQHLLRMLPRRQRDAVRLRYIERLPLNAVAARMRIPAKMVSNHINKARATVRALAAAMNTVGAS
jgi:RNA polymerase sigma-70 factor (ECF subfamily)